MIPALNAFRHRSLGLAWFAGALLGVPAFAQDGTNALPGAGAEPLRSTPRMEPARVEATNTPAPTATNTMDPLPSPVVPQLPARTNSLVERSTNATPATPDPRDFSAFKLIADRNIFNPNRTPGSGRAGFRPPVENRPTARAELITLVGIMAYDKGLFAFFDGTSASQRKVLRQSDTIAGYTITNVAPGLIKLVANGKGVDMRPGMQLRREDDGRWTLVARTELAVSQPTSSSLDSDAAADGDDAEVLKKMMQKREQELSK